MNSEESRLRTFSNWPENAVVDQRRIAKGGFYYMGQGLEVQCFSCGGRISEWSIGDCVMARHRSLDPHCPFVNNPGLSGNIPVSSNPVRNAVIDQLYQEAPSVYHRARARHESFAAWPISHIISPQLLAESGFYYTQIHDRVRCAFCNGVVVNWESDDIPDREHQRHFPNCSFMRNKGLQSWDLNSGINIRPSTTIAEQGSDSDGAPDFLKLLGVQCHRVPRHPKYSTYESRLKTFSQWPPSLFQKPHELAEAGFYFTGRGDQVRCFHCDGGLRLWEREDRPWMEHARWFPTCPFILLIKGPEFVDAANPIIFTQEMAQAQSSRIEATSEEPRTDFYVTEEMVHQEMNTPNSIAGLEMGVERSWIKAAVRERMERSGAPHPTPQALVIAALNIQARRAGDAGEQWSTPPNTPGLDGEEWEMELPSPSPLHSPDVSEETDLHPHQVIEQYDNRGSESRHSSGGRETVTVTSNPSSLSQRTNPQELGNTNIYTNVTDGSENMEQETAEVENLKSEEVNIESVPLSLEEENRRLREARLCKICMDSAVCVVFLPCRHLVTCVKCAPSLSDCPLCRMQIKATVTTFLS